MVLKVYHSSRFANQREILFFVPGLACARKKWRENRKRVVCGVQASTKAIRVFDEETS